MTPGSILPKMLQFAIPMMMGNLFQHLYNLADMTIAGYALGDHALAAISATAALVTLINTTAMGFNTGNIILMAQACRGAVRTRPARRFRLRQSSASMVLTRPVLPSSTSSTTRTVSSEVKAVTPFSTAQRRMATPSSK